MNLACGWFCRLGLEAALSRLREREIEAAASVHLMFVDIMGRLDHDGRSRVAERLLARRKQ